MDFWPNRKVFVTGATGLVGSWLVNDLLKAGARVVILLYEQHPQAPIYQNGDIHKVIAVPGRLEDPRILEKIINEHEIETVFHLGAQTIVGAAQRDPFGTFETNIRGTYNLLEACRSHKGLVQNIVVASSDKAYGDQAQLPYQENHPLQGRYPYDVSKSCTDLIAQAYVHTYALPVAIARCGNIYGGGDLNWSRIVPGTIQSFLNQQPPVIRSDGKYVRDYIYVKDVCRAYMLLAQELVPKRLAGEAFNFSYDTPVTVLDMVEAIARVMGCQHLPPKILNNAKAEIQCQYLSSAKAKRVLGWAPAFGLEEGLAETVRWYQDTLHKVMV